MSAEITDKDRLDAIEGGYQIVCHSNFTDDGWETKCFCNYGVDKQTEGGTIREAIDKALTDEGLMQ